MLSIKSALAKPFAKRVYKKIQKWANNPIETQDKVFKNLIREAASTAFGKDHDFKRINSYQDFVKRVPIRDYEQLKPYVDRVVAGEPDILWKGKPLYFAKTSGTTSGAKYIPLTKQSMPTHVNAAKNAILLYIHETGNSKFVDGKMIFLQGSPILKEQNGIQLGRLSGIVAHFVPKYLQKNRMPSWENNCIEDWETKVDAIVEETLPENMTIISGIPS
ncbi:MAG: GH3 auxin-responsive promoter family protein, partial [Olleya sp.]